MTSDSTRAREARASELIPGCDCLYKQRLWLEPRRAVIVEGPNVEDDGTVTWNVNVDVNGERKPLWGYLDQFSIEEPVTAEEAA